jgi:hypothetical protein
MCGYVVCVPECRGSVRNVLVISTRYFLGVYLKYIQKFRLKTVYFILLRKNNS